MGKKVNLSEQNMTNLVTDYVDNRMGIAETAAKYKIGKLRLKALLAERGIHIRSGSEQNTEPRTIVVADAKTKKYLPTDKGHYVAVSKKDGTVFDDIENRGGFLTSYIRKELGIDVPPLFARNKYYQETGNYWWEQFFDAKFVEEKPVKKCPYCDWTTEDVDNRSGAFEKHLRERHGLSIEEHIKAVPADIDYFSKFKAKQNREELLTDDKNYVICPICGRKMEKITLTHIKNAHNVDYSEFRRLYPEVKVISDSGKEQLLGVNYLSNIVTPKSRFVSKQEKEIQSLLEQNNIPFECNRQLLIGKEIDILIPDKKLGIEIDGLKWHTEWFGQKAPYYHLEKTRRCNEKGYGLLHIFEDEIEIKRDIVYAKVLHLLNRSCGIKISGRKCNVKEISNHEAKEFLDKYHLLGFAPSSVYLGAFYNEALVAVMSFKNGGVNVTGWELNRFGSDYHYICQGIGGKLFAFFVKNYCPDKVTSFADRRWTPHSNDSFYTKIGFKLDKIGKPDFYYYNECVDKYKRFSRISMTADKIREKHPEFSDAMTETEIARALGYDRIWNCGLFRYVWTKEEKR